MESSRSTHAHSDRARRLLDALLGQWIESSDSNADQVITRLVTSRGWVLCGSASLPGGPITKNDARLSGAVIVGCMLSPSGPLTLTIADGDGSRGSELVVHPPWALDGPRGAALAMRPDALLGIREESGPRHATAEALSTWAESEPSRVELELLESAEDDWLSPADIVSALVRAGITDDMEIQVRGIDLLARLIARGDVVAGTIGAEGFSATSDPVPAVIEHMATTWTALGGRTPARGRSHGSISPSSARPVWTKPGEPPRPDPHTNALTPVTDLPTMRDCMVSVPS